MFSQSEKIAANFVGLNRDRTNAGGRGQRLELQKYEEKIHHLADQNIKIDLDDDMKHNYTIFEEVLVKIR